MVSATVISGGLAAAPVVDTLPSETNRFGHVVRDGGGAAAAGAGWELRRRLVSPDARLWSLTTSVTPTAYRKDLP